MALTFDDGPTPETTPRLLRLLEDWQAKATFFVTGVRASQHPDLIEAIVDGGHSVYGHGWEHINYERNPWQAVSDMCRVEEELGRHRPTPKTYLVRLPYNVGYARVRFHRAMAAFHPDVQFAWWSHSTYDWLIPMQCRNPDDLFGLCHAATEKLKRDRDLGGGVILLHEKPFDIASTLTSEVSVVLTAMILRTLADRGLRCVSLKPARTSGPLQRWILTPTASTNAEI